MNKIDLPFTIAPSQSCLKLTTAEEGDTHVEFAAWYREDSRYEAVRISFARAVCSRSVSWLVSESKIGIGFLDSDESKWLNELNAAQIERYPNHPSNFKRMKHYYFGGHDCAVEVIAEGLDWVTLENLTNR